MRCSATPLVDHDLLCDSDEMAIAFARARYISRSTGGSAARSAAYNARAEIGDERTGEVFYFKHRDAPEHHEVLLPDGADEKFADAATLWNAAEAAERRKDSQVAREIVMALPANAEVSNEDRIELARSFAQEHFVAKGLAVQLDIHAPHGGDLESERANCHAHLLITTRRIEGDRLSATKARDLAPDIRQAGARAFVAEGEEWGALWREHQDRYFLATGSARGSTPRRRMRRSISGRCACAPPRAKPTSGRRKSRGRMARRRAILQKFWRR